MGLLEKFLRAGEGKRLKQLWQMADHIASLEPTVKELSDGELKARTDEFKARLADGETLDDIMPEAFATSREAARRVLGLRAYDVQMIGGMVIHQGDIAQMRTGEGKTLTSVMPVYLNALTGKGVHVVTVNPYLASRDAQQMGRVHGFMGLTTGYVHSEQSRWDKQRAYNRDITYATNNELGFDYLRDHMMLSPDELVQRGHEFAIVDEIDSILIDEARTPLIISGPADESSQWYQVFAQRIAPRLRRDEHYDVDEAKRTIGLTEDGVEAVEAMLGVGNLYADANTPLIHYLENSIRAKELFVRDDQYIVEEGEVMIVDEHTGRTLPGRRYSDGLHQAIEAKEGVEIQKENQTLATITLQNYFRNYNKLGGMTGTAETEEAEFAETYDMGVVAIPTNRPVIRVDHSDLVFRTLEGKMSALVEDIRERQAKGQPVLVGTASVDQSEDLSQRLRKEGIDHTTLNAKNHFREADIIAQAGRVGSVTVATNMAGRGVDIMLGGNSEYLATKEANRIVGAEPVLDPETGEAEDRDAWEARWKESYDEALSRYEDEVLRQREQVLEAGGLYVIGTVRHESRRIDNQLRGRSGRQGDPGESRFYLSLEDDLMRLFNANAVATIMQRFNVPEDVPIEHKMVSRGVERAQAQVESRNFEIRKNVLKYDDVMNEQRKVIYAEREAILHGDDEVVEELSETFVEDVVTNLCHTYAPEGTFSEEWAIEELIDKVAETFSMDNIEIDPTVYESKDGHARLVEDIEDVAMEAYEQRETNLGAPQMRQVERRVILTVLDRAWREHLYEMDQLRDGIGLRAVGQRDPLVEYKREAFFAFETVQARIKEEAVGYIFNMPTERMQMPAEQVTLQAQAPAAPLEPVIPTDMVYERKPKQAKGKSRASYSFDA